MARVIVTGGSGKVGRACVEDLIGHGYELIAERFPGVPIKKEVGPNETHLSIEKARRVLGYEPQYSWRKP